MEKPSCPCKKNGCAHHGNCEECKKHHEEAPKPVPVACETKRKTLKELLFHKKSK